MIMNKRAQLGEGNPIEKPSVFNLFTIIIIAFLAVLVFGGLIYVMGILNTTFHNVGLVNDATVPSTTPGYVNMTQASDDIFGQLNSSIQALRLVALTLIFSLLLGFIVSSALVRVNAAFFFVYILIVILAVIFSAPVSNAFYNISHSGIYEGNLLSFSGSNWIILNFPFVIAITGCLGGIFLFINILRGNEGGLE